MAAIGPVTFEIENWDSFHFVNVFYHQNLLETLKEIIFSILFVGAKIKDTYSRAI